MDPLRKSTNAFTGVHHNAPDNLSADDMDQRAENLKLAAAKKRQEESEQRIYQAAQETEKKWKHRDSLMEELALLNGANVLVSKLSLDDALELGHKRKELTEKIDALEMDLGFVQVAPTKERKTFGISSSKAIWSIAALTIFSFLLFWLLGSVAVADDPTNDSARRMLNSVGLRVVTNLLPFSMVFLTAVGFIWLVLPTVFAYWHSKVSTDLSLITDLEQCEPHQRVAFFAFAFCLPVWAFVMLMQVIFG
jgi:hypothetical protein